MPLNSKNIVRTLLCSALAAVASGAAAADAPAQLQDEINHVLLRMIESGQFSNSKDIRFKLDAPAQRVTNVGLIVDSASANATRDGLKVVAVSPGSSAQRMGVRSGDVLTAIEGQSLAGLGVDAAGHPVAPQKLRETIERIGDDAKLHFSVQRDGKPLELEGALLSVTLPPIHLSVGSDELMASTDGGAARGERLASLGGCGHINMFDVAPRSQNIHAATLLEIDGRLPGPERSSSFRISAGHHTLKVGELIESRYLSFNSRQRRDDTKLLDIDVQPNTTYYVGARLNSDKRAEWREGAYWDPIIWRQTPGECR